MIHSRCKIRNIFTLNFTFTFNFDPQLFILKKLLVSMIEFFWTFEVLVHYVCGILGSVQYIITGLFAVSDMPPMSVVYPHTHNHQPFSPWPLYHPQ